MTQQEKTDMQGAMMMFFVFAVTIGIMVFIFSTTKLSYE